MQHKQQQVKPTLGNVLPTTSTSDCISAFSLLPFSLLTFVFVYVTIHQPRHHPITNFSFPSFSLFFRSFFFFFGFLVFWFFCSFPFSFPFSESRTAPQRANYDILLNYDILIPTFRFRHCRCCKDFISPSAEEDEVRVIYLTFS